MCDPARGPAVATRQGACGFGTEARAKTKKSVRHGGRPFFLGTPSLLPHAFRTKARSPFLITATCVAAARSLVNYRVAAERGLGCTFPPARGNSRTPQLSENGFLGGHAVSGGLPGCTLLLMEQTIYMKWEKVSFFTVETANFYCSLVRWTLRYGAY